MKFKNWLEATKIYQPEIGIIVLYKSNLNTPKTELGNRLYRIHQKADGSKEDIGAQGNIRIHSRVLLDKDETFDDAKKALIYQKGTSAIVRGVVMGKFSAQEIQRLVRTEELDWGLVELQFNSKDGVRNLHTWEWPKGGPPPPRDDKWPGDGPDDDSPRPLGPSPQGISLPQGQFLAAWRIP